MAMKLKQQIEIKLGGRFRLPILKLTTLALSTLSTLCAKCDFSQLGSEVLKIPDILNFSSDIPQFWDFLHPIVWYFSDIQELQDCSGRFEFYHPTVTLSRNIQIGKPSSSSLID